MVPFISQKEPVSALTRLGSDEPAGTAASSRPHTHTLTAPLQGPRTPSRGAPGITELTCDQGGRGAIPQLRQDVWGSEHGEGCAGAGRAPRPGLGASGLAQPLRTPRAGTERGPP